MPLHDYECQACKNTCELMVDLNAGHPRKCPACGKLRLKRLLFTRPPVAHMRYSPMHPRRGRGMSKR